MEEHNKNNFEPLHESYQGFWPAGLSCCVVSWVVSCVSKDCGVFVLKDQAVQAALTT